MQSLSELSETCKGCAHWNVSPNPDSNGGVTDKVFW